MYSMQSKIKKIIKKKKVWDLITKYKQTVAYLIKLTKEMAKPLQNGCVYMQAIRKLTK